MSSAFPPAYTSQPIFSRKLRFQADGTVTANQAFVIARSNILNLMLAYSGAGATTYARLNQAVKVEHVSVWGIGTTSNSTVSLEWLGPYIVRHEISDTGNALRPAHISCSPPKDSFASLWSSGGNNETDQLFSVSLNPGDVIDVVFSYQIADGAVGTVGWIVQPVAGIFIAPLDSIAAALLRPVSLSMAT